MSNRSPSVSPLASPLRRMQAAGVTGRINPYCSRRANFRSVKEVKACLAAISDSPSNHKKTKSPIVPTSCIIKTPPSRRSTHNVITPEARIMMKEAVAEFSSPLTDVKKIPMRESPIFPLPASKRRKLFDMKDEILKEVEKNKAEMKEKQKKLQKTEIAYVKLIPKDSKLTGDDINTRKTCEQELLEIQEIYPEFKFSNPRSLTAQTHTNDLLQFDDEFRFSSAANAKQKKTQEETYESSQTTEVPPTNNKLANATKAKSKQTPTAPVVTLDKELAERFKPPEGSWECEVCMINNKSDISVCIACTALKPASLSNQPAVPTKSIIQPDKDLLARFKMGADKWECDTCMIQNSQSDDKCLACEAPKPGTQSKDSSAVKADSKPAFTTGLQLNIKPNTSSSAPLKSFSGGIKIPGFSLGKPTQPNTSSVSLPSSLTLPPLKVSDLSSSSKIDFGLSLLKQTTTSSMISLSSITSTSGISLFKTNITSNPVTSAPTPETVPKSTEAATVSTALTSKPVTSILPPSLSLSTPFPTLVTPISSQSKVTVTSTTYSLPLSQTTPSLQPSAPLAPLASPPRGSQLSLPPPMTPQKSVDEEAMEVIPFSGTLTTPVKGASSVPTSSPFNFLSNPTSNKQTTNTALPIPSQGGTQANVTPANESIFKGVNPHFQFSNLPSASAFHFGGGNTVVTTTPQQAVTDNSTGQDLKPFQFKASSQPIPQFAHSKTPQSNSQPDNPAPNPSFTPNQPQASNLFGAQPKPPNSLFTIQPQPPNFPGSNSGSSLFNVEPQKMASNLFKQATPGPFQFTPKSQAPPLFSPGGNFQFTPSPAVTPATPATGVPFPFTGGQPAQANTPTTPQTPAYNFNVGSSESSNMKGRVYKTAKRRLK